MSKGYQRSDAQFVDYQLYELPGVHGTFRGPPVSGGKYIACIGASQTFGRFVQHPFSHLLGRELGVETLNLGRGGAGPSYVLGNAGLLKYVNAARMAIVQVFSGRSESNSMFRVAGYGMKGTNVATGRDCTADEFFTWLLEERTGEAERIVRETRENYVTTMSDMLTAIQPPKILFWFSARTPDYEEKLELPLWRLLGEFPQLVNRGMVEQLKSYCDCYVECVSRRGLPQPLFDRSQGELRGSGNAGAETAIPAAINRYYPSPEMHEDAAAMLLPVCRQILARSGG